MSINWLITGYDNSIGNEFMDTINNNCQHLNNNGLALLLAFSNFLLTQKNTLINLLGSSTHMPAYKDKNNTWLARFYYTDYTGKRTQKKKRGS